MTKEDLIHYKKALARPVDVYDIESIREGSYQDKSTWTQYSLVLALHPLFAVLYAYARESSMSNKYIEYRSGYK